MDNSFINKKKTTQKEQFANKEQFTSLNQTENIVGEYSEYKNDEFAFDETKSIEKVAEAPKQDKTQKKKGFFAGKVQGVKSFFTSSSKNKEKKLPEGPAEVVKLAEEKEEEIKVQLSREEIIQINKDIYSLENLLDYRSKSKEGGVYPEEQRFHNAMKGELDNMSKKERDALEDYWNDGFIYMNRYLRTGETKEPGIQDETKELTNLINRCSLPEKTALVRNITLDSLHFLTGRKMPYKDVKHAVNDLKNARGLVIQEKGFCSTTLEPTGVGSFENMDVEMRILAPKGAHACYFQMEDMGYDDEKEVLLPPGSKFQILKVEEEERKWAGTNDNMTQKKVVIYMKVLPQEEVKEEKKAA